MHFGIIAAGEGSRLAGEGVATPKPLLPIDGKPMIERLIDIFTDCGAESINIVINGFMPEVRAFLENLKKRHGCPVNLKIKTTPSSMHTFYELMSMMGRGRFIATTVDTIFKEDDFRKYVAAFETSPQDIDGLMAVTDYIDDEKPLYVDVDSTMDIRAFLDTPYDGFRYVSGGIYGLDHKAFGVLKDCMERGVSRMRNFQRELIASGLCIKAYPMGKIIDVDHVSDIKRAQELLNGN